MKSSEIPLGLLPRYIYIENRIRDIKEAIDRYLEANFTIPVEWIGEYNELVKELISNG